MSEDLKTALKRMRDSVSQKHGTILLVPAVPAVPVGKSALENNNLEHRVGGTANNMQAVPAVPVAHNWNRLEPRKKTSGSIEAPENTSQTQCLALAGTAGTAGTSKKEANPNFTRHRAKVKKSGLCPRIICEPPFGSDGIPPRYAVGWDALLSRCPPGVRPVEWQAAICDAADLFGWWGAELVRLDWAPANLFEPPQGSSGGLVWAIKGHPVMALGPDRAFLRDGRIFERSRGK
jgi:hypothetical protein